jgi:hypothetical protein
MTVSPRLSPYEMLVAVRPQLLEGPANTDAISLLGQAVSDVLDDDSSESVVLQLVADLESARSSAMTADINRRWALPLTALLGLLRQHLHNRSVQSAAIDPASVTLRDKVLAALDVGIDTPTAIGEYVQSPTTVVSRVLRQLAEQGRVQRAEAGEDKRRRPYRRADAAPELSQLIDPDTESSPERGIADVAALIDFAERQTHCNIKTASALLPNLIAAGSDEHLSPSLRVSALGVAGVIVRADGASNAGDDALDLAETAEVVAAGSGDNLLRARAAYDRARAVLFAMPHEIETCLSDLRRAEEFAQGDWSPAGQILLGWCAYTHGLIEEGKDLTSATKYANEALTFFRNAGFDYGATAALTQLARVDYANAAWEDAADHALEALSIANSHGYLRLMAESSFWAGDLLSENDPHRAEQLFTTAAEIFEAVGSRHWRALSYAARALAKVRRDPGLLGEKAEGLLNYLLQLQEEMSTSETSWAAAVLNRWIGVCARYARQYEVAQEHLDASVDQYVATTSAPGLLLAKAGLLATKGEHFEIEGVDLAGVLEDDDFAFGAGNVAPAAKGALEQLEGGALREFGAF